MTVAASFADIFQGFTKRFGQYTVQGVNETKNKHEGRASTLDRAPTIEDYENHLAGRQRMGIVPLMDDGRSIRFAAIDVDLYPDKDEPNRDLIIDQIVEKIGERPLFVTRSKSGGAHIWLLTKDPVDATVAFKAMKELAGELGYGNAEIFPKQTVRNDPTDTGNWINIPYFGDICKCRAFDDEAGEFYDLSLEDFLVAVEGVEQSWVDAWLAEYDYNPLDELSIRDKPSEEDFVDGPPCLVSILKGFIADGSVPQGGRNDLLFDIGLYFKRKYESQDVVFSKLILLDNGNATLNGKKIPAFGVGEKEIRTTLMKSLMKKEYHYRCNRSPLSDHCKAKVCRTRAFGVSGADEAILPDGITIYKYGPTEKQYYLSLSKHGHRLGPFQTSEIMSFKAYREAVTTLVNAIPPTIDDKTWTAYVNQLFASARKNEVIVPNAGKADRFAQLIAAWLDEKAAKRPEMILVGRPLIIDGHIQFRINDLLEFLRSRGMMMTAEAVYDLIRSVDFDAKTLDIQFEGKNVSVWQVTTKGNPVFQRAMTQPKKGVDDVPF